MTSKIISQDSPVPTASPGSADIVGFGKSGVIIRRANLPPTQVIANFGSDAGWQVGRHVRLVADITGDKHGDIVGFGENGVWISINNGNNTFQPLNLAISNFAIGAGGWATDKHIRFMADIRNVGRADVVGFGDGGVWVAPNNGNGVFGGVTLGLANFGYSQGWRLDRHLRFLADVSGDGLPDIVGFGEDQVYVGRNNGNGTFQPITGVVQNFCYNSAGGWRIEKHPRFLADLTGDGRADIIGFGDPGVFVSLNNGDGTFQPLNRVIDDFAYVAGGWRVEKHPRLIADLTGDGRGDIVGFGDPGVYISLNNGNGTFQPPKLVINNFGYDAGGWRVEKHLRFAVDLTGDGRADIVGFGENAVWVSYNAGNGNFGPVQQLTDSFGFNGGQWALDQTVRYMANL